MTRARSNRATLERWAEAVWYGTSVGPAAVRAALAPAAALFRLGATVRGRLYDTGILAARPLGAPAISVGNVTVGGTGKTPIAAWVVAELAARGARPAVLLRGVGGDEARVHALLNPAAPVITDPDRVRAARAAIEVGADALVLDDAFQHRRAARDVDLVLVAAETFARGARMLPAGPLREPFTALQRASAVVITRKSASAPAALAVARDVAARHAPEGTPIAVASLVPDRLVPWGMRDAGAEPATRSVSALAGARAFAIAGVGAPGAFEAQLRSAGASLEFARFPDHHAYTRRDAADLARRAAAADYAVTTLKDAVKLGPLWPATSGALWYVTQRVTLDAGAPELAWLLDGVAAAARARGPSLTPDRANLGPRGRQY